MTFDKLKPGMVLCSNQNWVIVKRKSSNEAICDWYLTEPWLSAVLDINYNIQFKKFDWDSYGPFMRSKPATLERMAALIVAIFEKG